MPSKLVTFDGLTLPTLYLDGDGLKSTAEIPSDLVTLAGGRKWDARRTDRARPSEMRCTMDCVIVGTSAADLQTQENNLRAKHGVEGTLTRQDLNGASQTITARMSVPEATETAGGGPLWRPISLIFDTVEWPWAGTAHNDGPVTITGSEGNQTMTNAGNAPWFSTILDLLAGSGSVTAFTFTAGPDAAGRKWQWNWAGTLAATKHLIIYAGSPRVLNDGAANYGVTLGATHNQNHWVEVPNGGLTFAVTVTHSGTDPSLTWLSYDGWAT